MIFIAKPLCFPGIIFDQSLLCYKTQTQWFLELQKRVIFIAKPSSFQGIIFEPSLFCNKNAMFFSTSKEDNFHSKIENYFWPESRV